MNALRALKWSAAFVWLVTGVLVLHPFYRVVGAGYLQQLGLPEWLMYVACAAEVVLAALVAFGRARVWLCVAQLASMAFFMAALSSIEPMLLVHPYGVLTKNLPLGAVIVCATLVERGGWSGKALWVLRGGLALIWFTEGLFPKVLFQQPLELAVVAASGLVPFSPALFLTVLGGVQMTSAVLALTLRGPWLRAVLVAQGAALIALPVLVTWHDGSWWVHPFAPMFKNVPMLVGTAVAVQQLSKERL